MDRASLLLHGAQLHIDDLLRGKYDIQHIQDIMRKVERLDPTTLLKIGDQVIPAGSLKSSDLEDLRKARDARMTPVSIRVRYTNETDARLMSFPNHDALASWLASLSVPLRVDRGENVMVILT